MSTENSQGKPTEHASTEGTIDVVTSSSVRGRNIRPIPIIEVTQNIRIFIQQIDSMLSNTPSEIGGFQFDEFEVFAEITAKGTLAILGTGGEAGASGGVKFVFRRKSS